MYSIYGAWIGVPSNFYYKSTKDIDKDNICIRNNPMTNWNTEHGKMLEQSLLFSESEQIFAFCQALLDLQSMKIYLNSFTPSAIFLNIYFAAQKINQGQHLYGRLFLVRFIKLLIKSQLQFESKSIAGEICDVLIAVRFRLWSVRPPHWFCEFCSWTRDRWYFGCSWTR